MFAAFGLTLQCSQLHGCFPDDLSFPVSLILLSEEGLCAVVDTAGCCVRSEGLLLLMELEIARKLLQTYIWNSSACKMV